MKRLSVFIILSILLSSCGQANTPVAPSVTFTPLPLATATQMPSPTPQGPYNIVTDATQENQMSILTLDDLKTGKLAGWELSQVNKLSPIAKNPSEINLVVTTIPSVGVSYLSPSNLDKTSSTRATEFFSLYKIQLDPWGFPGVQGYVASYIWEDKNGDKAMLHFLLGKPGLAYLNQYGWFEDPLGFYISPADSMDEQRTDSLFLPNHLPSPDDIRPIVDVMYKTQGLAKADISSLFASVASSGTWGDNKDQVESIVFDGYINYYAPLDNLLMPTIASESQTTSLSVSPKPILSLDIMNYQFDPDVNPEDQAAIKKAAEFARYYLISTYGRDIKGSYLIRVVNDPSDQASGEFGRVNGEGTHQVMTINVGHHWWQEYDLPSRLMIVHEFVHLWQGEQGNGWPGCRYLQDATGLPGSHDTRTHIFTEGQAQYDSIMATGMWSQFNLTTADAEYMLKTFDQRINKDYDVMAYMINYLIKKTSSTAFRNYCDEIGQGKTFDVAFESAFGIKYQEFIKQLKNAIHAVQLGCQDITTCDYDSLVKYGSLLPMIDPSLKSPNLMIKLTNQQGRPASDIVLFLFRKMYNNIDLQTSGEDSYTDSNGILSAPVFPGTYWMHFCAPGFTYHTQYPLQPTKCVYELDPFIVSAGQTTNVEFKFWDIQDHSLASPNFLATVLDVDGKPLATQYVQVCGYDATSIVCVNGATQDDGVFRASLKPGNYLIREVQPNDPLPDSRGYVHPEAYGRNYAGGTWFPAQYEIRDIKIEAGAVKSFTFQFPKPNLHIVFLDSNGSPSPFISFYLCKLIDTSNSGLSPQDVLEKQMTSEILSHMFGAKFNSVTVKLGSLDGTCFLNDQTDKHGDFQIKVDPGKYFVYFDNPGNQGVYPVDWTFDHMLSDINVTDDQLTMVSYQFK